jgi:uncharacterized protein
MPRLIIRARKERVNRGGSDEFLDTERHYEWDADKATRNLQKHNVAFEEAASVFDDPDLITVIDDEHSLDEERYITIGMSSQTRLLMVAHTDRGGRIRIISTRRATKNEAQFYAEAE